ncbi:hypothetical protein ACFQ88_11980 [Paenibacillus sp. NPDC056579]|uniref:hypothetical protein n=1 Tax=Paenibacillus sp. NPDC056579 TaxID=3345871 RepID=UPI0036C32C53
MEPTQHSIKNPSGIKLIMSMIVLSAISLFNAIRLFKDQEHVILLCAMAAVFLFCLMVLLLSFYRALKKPAPLYLYDGKMILNGAAIQAEDIKVIMRMGYFKPTIGIKPHGVSIVPIRMCFRFANDEKAGITELVNWAEKNNVAMVHRSFVRWI